MTYHDGMIGLPGGRILVGSEAFYPEERPQRWVDVEGFSIDATPVTNADFTRFVDDSGYVTEAERALDGRCGGLVFALPAGRTITRVADCWAFVDGACWRSPLGPGTSASPDHPVVQVTLADAVAYAKWADKVLPTECQWEYAARGHRVGAEFAWGDTLAPDGNWLANYWVGEFPFDHDVGPAVRGTMAVGSFPANEFGLFDMIGNVWEWTADRWSIIGSASSCCGASGAGRQMVLKGGSYLCAENYCQRYRPAARHPQAADTPSSHVGFRCVAI